MEFSEATPVAPAIQNVVRSSVFVLQLGPLRPVSTFWAVAFQPFDWVRSGQRAVVLEVIVLSSTEERLKQILRRMQQETDANARAHESAAEADRVKKDLKQLQDRWAYDTTLIEAAIKTLQEKLQGIQFRFLAGPRNPGTVATAELAGKVGNNASGKITFNVFETGIVRIYFDRKAPSEFLLMTSNQEKYESVLLDFVERLIDCPQSN